jgi:hypothetical protein
MSLITRRQNLPDSTIVRLRGSGGQRVPEATLPDAVKAKLRLCLATGRRGRVVSTPVCSEGFVVFLRLSVGVHEVMLRPLLAPFAICYSLIILPFDVNPSYSRRRRMDA